MEIKVEIKMEQMVIKWRIISVLLEKRVCCYILLNFFNRNFEFLFEDLNILKMTLWTILWE